MKTAGAFRWTVAAAVLAAMLASALSFRADAQSEYMRGDRMPYDAFDRLPRTDIEVPGGTIHVAFAPGDMCYSGVMSTAGGLVFVGRNNGQLQAYDDQTGKLVLEGGAGTGIATRQLAGRGARTGA